jgi:hypothetical protein
MRYGLGIARRAWLEKDDILNCLGADELLGKSPPKKGRSRRP